MERLFAPRTWRPEASRFACTKYSAWDIGCALCPARSHSGRRAHSPFPTGNCVCTSPSPTGQRCAGSAEGPSLCRSRGEEGTLPQPAGCGSSTSPRPTHWTKSRAAQAVLFSLSYKPQRVFSRGPRESFLRREVCMYVMK